MGRKSSNLADPRETAAISPAEAPARSIRKSFAYTERIPVSAAIAYVPDTLTLEPSMVPDGVELVTVVEADGDEPHGTLGQALAVIAAGDADTLLLAELGAAAGSLDEVIWLLGWLRESGARLIVLDVGLDTATDPGRATVGVLAEIDRLQRERGPHRPPRGRPGIGHARPELAERITALRARGLSLQAIARELNDAGIPTPRGGREWRASSVQAALGYRRPRPPAPGVPPPRPPGGRGPGKPGRRHGPPPPPPPHRPR